MRFLLAFLMIFGAASVYADELRSDDMAKQMQISSLKREIDDLENQLTECKRKNKNWRTATWIGAAGTVATGTAAIVQGVKLHNLKKENGNITTQTPQKQNPEKPGEPEQDGEK